MAVTTKKLFPATSNATTTVFSPVGIQLNNQDDLDVYVTLSGGTRVLQLRQSTGSTAQSSHPQVNNTDGLYFPAVTAGTTLYNYTLSTDNNTITFNSALPQGAVVFCERRTRDADSSYTSFASGSTIRATDLNNSSTESNFTAQDARNKALTIEGVLFNGDQPSTNFVTSNHIVDGTINDGDIANDAIISSKIADDQINSEHYVDGSIDTQHIANENITTAKLANDAVTASKVADNAINTAQIIDGAVTNAKLASNAIGTAAIVSGAVSTDKINDGAITTAKIAADAITQAKIADDAVGTDQIATSSITNNRLAADAVTGAKIADDAVDSEHIAAGALDNEHYAAGSITSDKLNGATVITASEQGSATTNDTSFLTSAAADARFFNISSSETIKDGDTFPNNDTTIATTAAINDRIIDLVDDVGGFVPIANETSFPTANPDVNNGSGTLVSIKSISSTRTPSSGTVTIANGAGTGNTVSITGCGSTVLTSGFGVIVETTSTLHTYAFHRLVPKATEVTTVAGISSNVTTVATNIADINTVAADLNEATSEIDTVATNIANVNTVGNSIANVNTTAGSIANVNTTAGSITNVNNVGNNISNVNSVAGNASNINSAVSNASNINSAVSNASNINTVAGSISNVNTVGTNISSVNNVSSNISDVNNFADLYQIHANNPSTDGGGNALAAGDLYFNTNSNSLKVYTGNAWVDGVTATGSFAVTTGNTFTGDNVYNDNVKLNLGTSSDLEIVHNGTNSVIDNSTGTLFVQANAITFTGQGNSENLAKFTKNADVKLYYNNSEKFKTQSTGVYVAGNISLSGNVDGRDVAADGTKLDGIASGAIANLVEDTTPQLGGNLDTNGNNIHFPDNNSARFGTSQDGLDIYHNGSDSYIVDQGTGYLIIQGSQVKIRNTSGHPQIVANNDVVELYYDNAKKFETTSTGTTTTGDALLTDAIANEPKLRIETTDGGNKRLDLFVDSSAVATMSAQQSAQNIAINARNNTIFSQGGLGSEVEAMRIDPSGRLLLGTTTEGEGDADDFTIAGSGNTGITIRSGTSNDGAIFFSDGTSGNAEFEGTIQYLHSANAMTFKTNHAEQIRIDSSGNVGIGTTSPSRKLVLAGDTNTVASINGATNGTSSLFLGDTDDEDIGALTYNHVNNFLSFTTNASERMRINSSGNVGIGSTSPQNALDLGNATGGRGIAWGGPSGTAHYATVYTEYSTGSLILGAGVKGSTSSTDFIAPFTGTLGNAIIELQSFQDDGIIFYVDADASRTAGNTITPTERIRIKSDGDIKIPDTGKYVAGAGNDLQVFHNGTNSFVNNSTGYLFLQSNNFAIRSLSGTNKIASGGDEVTLFHGASGKLATTSTGVTVTGTVAATSYTGDGSNLTGIDTDLVSDTSPQLGGLLDGNGQTANFTANNTGLGIPIGTDANEPSAGSYKGYIRYNDDDDQVYYSNGTNWLKISAAVPTLSSISGNFFSGVASTVTLTGTNFLSSNLVVNFVQSSDSINVNTTVTPTSDTSASVAVPASVYNNLTAGNVITVKVTNSDNVSSGVVNKTAIGLPSGGTITTSGNFRIHTFTSSGTFTNTISNLSVQYLVIGGGGGGGTADTGANAEGGGGGAGGYRTNVPGQTSGRNSSAEAALTVSGNQTVTVGAGGAGGSGSANTLGTSGSNSVFGSIVSLGGGRGGANSIEGDSGGSGGGGMESNGTGRSGTAGQGFDGGPGSENADRGGGGGGAGSNGGTTTGGNGLSSNITGTAVTRAGGGGSNGAGGSGGGGDGNNSGTGGNGAANTGSGGAAAHTNAGAGGSGIVIVRYDLTLL